MAIKTKWVDYYDPKQDITDLQTQVEKTGAKSYNAHITEDSSGSWSLADHTSDDVIGSYLWNFRDIKIGDVFTIITTPYSSGLSIDTDYTAVVVSITGSLRPRINLQGLGGDIVDISIANNDVVTVTQLRKVYSAPTEGNKVLTSVDNNGTISTQWADAGTSSGSASAVTYTVYIKSETITITSATWTNFSDAKIGDFIWLRDQTTNIQYEATIINKNTTSSKTALTLAGLTGDIVNVILYSDNTIKISKLQKINYPNPTEVGKVLLSTEENGKVVPKWMDYSTEDMVSYGLSYGSFKNPTNVGIGNPTMLKSLPVQSGMVTGIFKGSELQYWLKPNDWTMIDGLEEDFNGDQILLNKGYYVANYGGLWGLLQPYNPVQKTIINNDEAYQEAIKDGVFEKHLGCYVIKTIRAEEFVDHFMYTQPKLIGMNVINTKTNEFAYTWPWCEDQSELDGDLPEVIDMQAVQLTNARVVEPSPINSVVFTIRSTINDSRDYDTLKSEWQKYGSEPHMLGVISVFANRTGYEGEVMTYVPTHGMKCKDGEIKIFPDVTTQAQANQYGCNVIQGFLVSTYPLSIVRSNPKDGGYLSSFTSYPAMVSVCNDKAYCRGGSNDATKDQWLTTYKLGYPMTQFTQLRKPITAVSRATARTYASVTGASLLTYEKYMCLAFLWAVENKKINSVYVDRDNGTYLNVTAPGGGFYGATPRVPIGLLDDWANNSCIAESSRDWLGGPPEFSWYLSFEVFNESVPENLSQQNIGGQKRNMWITKFRGIENLFGDSYTCVDGALWDMSSNSPTLYYYPGLDASKYDTSTGYAKSESYDGLISGQSYSNFIHQTSNSYNLIPNHDYISTSTRQPRINYTNGGSGYYNVLMGSCMTDSADDLTMFNMKCDIHTSDAPSNTLFTSTYRSMRLVGDKPTL